MENIGASNIGLDKVEHVLSEVSFKPARTFRALLWGDHLFVAIVHKLIHAWRRSLPSGSILLKVIWSRPLLLLTNGFSKGTVLSIARFMRGGKCRESCISTLATFLASPHVKYIQAFAPGSGSLNRKVDSVNPLHILVNASPIIVNDGIFNYPPA